MEIETKRQVYAVMTSFTAIQKQYIKKPFTRYYNNKTSAYYIDCYMKADDAVIEGLLLSCIL